MGYTFRLAHVSITHYLHTLKNTMPRQLLGLLKVHLFHITCLEGPYCALLM